MKTCSSAGSISVFAVLALAVPLWASCSPGQTDFAAIIAPSTMERTVLLHPDRQEGPSSDFTSSLVDVTVSGQTRDLVRAILYGGTSAEEYAQNELAEFTAMYRKDGAELESFYGAEGGPLSSLSFYESVSTELLSSNPRVLSFARYRESYIGGAHPSHQTEYVVIDVGEKRALSFDDLFPGVSGERVLESAELALKEENHIPPDKTLDADGFFFEPHVTPPSAVALGSDGVELLWNEYEIAPYAAGPVQVVLPYSSVSGLLSPEARSLVQDWLDEE